MNIVEVNPTGYRDFLIKTILKPEYQAQAAQPLGESIKAVLKPEQDLAIHNPELFILPEDSQPLLPPLSRYIANIALASWQEYVSKASDRSHKLQLHVRKLNDHFTSLDVTATLDELKKGSWTTNSIRFNKSYVPINIESDKGRYSFLELPPLDFGQALKLANKLNNPVEEATLNPFYNVAHILNLENETKLNEIPTLIKLSENPLMWVNTFNAEGMQVIPYTRLSTKPEINGWTIHTETYTRNPRAIGPKNTLGRRQYSCKYISRFDYPVGVQVYPLTDDNVSIQKELTIESYPVPIFRAPNKEPIGWLLMDVITGGSTPTVIFENALDLSSELSRK